MYINDIVAAMQDVEVSFSPVVDIEPRQLLTTTKRVPVDANYIALGLRVDQFELITPTISACGNTAVTFALGSPFGFVTGSEQDFETTQKTEVIELTRSAPALWVATFSVENDLAHGEEGLFTQGLSCYVRYVHSKMTKNAAAQQAAPGS